MKAANGNSAAKLIASGLIAVLALALPAAAQKAGSAGQSRIKRTVLVSIADRKLAVLEDGNVIASFPIAVGAAVSPSPTGIFEIVNRVEKPTYYHQGVVVPPGKDNPIGTRWVGLSEKGFGIHGTNAPRSIGHAASHGCIRLRNRDMERLFTMLRVGDVVQIRGERDEETAEIFGGAVDGSTLATAQTESLQAGGGQ
ncbi:MAG: L,D-transpeptidase [Acidobacteriia bacterium]|nr:L,D-transpeptidase [Terriglobia bacterium]